MTLKPKDVLIIEDDVSIQYVLSLALSEAGFNVIEASTGGAAMEKLRDTAALPCVVLLDLGLPDIEGYEIFKMLSDENLLAHVPVIVISGYTSLQSRIRSFLSGAKAFVNKPFQMDDLIEKVIYFSESHGNKDRQPSDNRTDGPAKTNENNPER